MIQKTVDDVYKGRVFSIFSIGAQILMPIGIILFGFLYGFYPAPPVLIISSLLLVMSALYLLRPGIGRKADPDLAIKNKTE